MTAAELPAGVEAAAPWAFKAAANGAAVAFAGRGMAGSREQVLTRLTGDRRQVAWARQVHSARVLRAQPGDCGEGDALVSRDGDLALSIVTADCVPVLLAGPSAIAAAHAGWRGIAAGVVGATVAAMEEDPESLQAWIGPAIGPCCYETGPDVAARVAAASDPAIVVEGPAGRPHLDLQLAVRRQLQAAGLNRIEALELCTRCEAATLHSYRREGKGAGRNHALIWTPPGNTLRPVLGD
ncbi:MAG TPA: peptidoglycan editing factor PgeF, partial [Thermoanaerobaculia bacterium]|nr:peptidoglycan editing factor PgeF [Thermoanaerobaculia bacterium]